jgi:hypothetical protein
MRAVWFIGKFELLLYCTKHPIYSPKSRTPQQPQNVTCKRKNDRANKTERTKKMCTFVPLNV